MSLWGRAAAGIGAGAVDITNKYITADIQSQRDQALADLQVKTAAQMRSDADAFNNDPTRVERDRANKVADITATGTATNQVALQGQIDAATNVPLTTAKVALAGSEALAKDQNTTRDAAPGVQQFRNGVMVDQNPRPTNAEVSAAAFAAGQKGNLGKTSKADNFSAKEWDDARKIDPSVVSFPDALGGKGVESADLRQVYRTKLTALQNVGDFSPQEASDMARETTIRLQTAASDRVQQALTADPKSKMTPQQAVKDILNEAQAAAAARAAAANPPAVAAPVDQSAAESARMNRPAASIAAAAAAAAPNAEMGGMASFSLQNIVDSPRMSATKRAAAQAELDRRKTAAPAVDQSAQYDPQNYR